MQGVLDHLRQGMNDRKDNEKEVKLSHCVCVCGRGPTLSQRPNRRDGKMGMVSGRNTHQFLTQRDGKSRQCLAGLCLYNFSHNTMTAKKAACDIVCGKAWKTGAHTNMIRHAVFYGDTKKGELNVLLRVQHPTPHHGCTNHHHTHFLFVLPPALFACTLLGTLLPIPESVENGSHGC